MACTNSPTAADIQTSLRRIEQAQIAKQAAITHRRTLHQQMSTLLDQIPLAYDEVTNKTSQLDRAADDHDRLTTLHLCTKLHATLPRELRDTIYDLVHGPVYRKTVKRLTQWDATSTATAAEEDRPFTFSIPRDAQDHFRYTRHPSLWWPDDHLSRAVARELVVRWYQLHHFAFDAKHLHLLPDFLAHDIFKKDVEPGTLIRGLRCNVPIVRNQDSRSRARVLGWLGNLGLIKNKRVELVVRLYCPWGLGDDERRVGIRAVLEVLRPLVREWREKGFERVQVWNVAWRQDLSGLFEGVRDEGEWRERLRSFGLGGESEQEQEQEEGEEDDEEEDEEEEEN